MENAELAGGGGVIDVDDKGAAAKGAAAVGEDAIDIDGLDDVAGMGAPVMGGDAIDIDGFIATAAERHISYSWMRRQNLRLAIYHVLTGV